MTQHSDAMPQSDEKDGALPKSDKNDCEVIGAVRSSQGSRQVVGTATLVAEPSGCSDPVVETAAHAERSGSGDVKLALANVDLSLNDAQLAGLCTWLCSALAAERHVVSLELERRHQQLLMDCAKRWGANGVQNGAGVAQGISHQVMQPSLIEAKKNGYAAKSTISIDKVSDASTGDEQYLGQHLGDSEGGKQEYFKESVEAFFEHPSGTLTTNLDEQQQVGGQPSLFGETKEFGLPERWTHRLVTSPAFELTFAIIICANTVAMAAETQYIGIGLGQKLTFPTFDGSKEDVWPGADTAFTALDLFFGIVFTVEILFKIVGLRWQFCRDIFNALDVVIVVSWAADKLLQDVVDLPVDPTLLRLIRLLKLLRIVKLLKSLKGVDQLFLMTTTIKGSVTVLVWTGLFLFTLNTMLAFLVNQIVVTYFLDMDGQDRVKQRETFKYFGTFSRSVLSMFEITLGNWVPIARNLYENVSSWFFLFSLLHKLTMGFAVIGVINGIFIQETFKVASCDDTVMLLQKARATKIHCQKMNRFFEKADKSGDGMLDRYEFKSILCRPEVKTWLAAQELDATDADSLFNLLDTGDKKLSAMELVKGVTKLKGAARSIDLAVLMREQREFKNIMREAIQRLSPDEGKHGERPLALSQAVDASLFANISDRTVVDIDIAMRQAGGGQSSVLPQQSTCASNSGKRPNGRPSAQVLL